MFRITHDESGDWAEASDRHAAHVAAKTLLRDNGGGSCRVWENDKVIDWVWLTEDDVIGFAFGPPKGGP